MTQESNNVNGNNGRHFFWHPWGALGCLWRTFVFLLGIVALTFLMSLLMKGCNHRSLGDDDDERNNTEQKVTDPDDPDYPDDPDNPYNRRQIPEDLRDNRIVDDWNDSIPGVKELPSPQDNVLPPVDTTRVVESPVDSLVQMMSGQLVVLFNSKDVKADMTTFARQFKRFYPDNEYRVTYYNPNAGLMLLEVPENHLEEVGSSLPNKIRGIDFLVTTNDIVNASAYKPSDPGFSKTNYDEYFRLIQAYDAWDITRGSSDVKVAIVDSYFDLTNPEIGTRYVDRINIATKTTDVLPPARMPRKEEIGAFCHGSHVAGLAIGGQNNGLGCSGIAPECTWIPVALGSGPWTTLHILEGVLYAIYHGADVVNMSIQSTNELMRGMPLGLQVLFSENMRKGGEAVWHYVVKTAKDHNCVIVKAAGNFSVYQAMDFMNRFPNEVVNVEAVDGKGQIADFSNFGIIDGGKLHFSTVAAPGVNLYSVGDRRFTDAQGFMEMGGTSMAAPVVTGAVALLKSKKKDITAEEVINVLRMTGKQTDHSGVIGPTIQIRDALDATGGQLLNFDDLMQNHDLLVGKWKSTHELKQTNEHTGAFIDNIWTYFIFTSPTSGYVEHHGVNSRKVYTAPLTVRWTNKSLQITQTALATTTTGESINNYDFDCHPNSKRLLEADAKKNGKKVFDLMLEKVK